MALLKEIIELNLYSGVKLKYLTYEEVGDIQLLKTQPVLLPLEDYFDEQT